MAYNLDGKNPEDEEPAVAIYASIETKFVDLKAGLLVIELTNQVEVDRFSFTTANDAPERDPVQRWLVRYSDGFDRVLLSAQRVDHPTLVELGQQTEWLPCLTAISGFLFFPLRPQNMLSQHGPNQRDCLQE
jgi:hypothetical protein